MRILSIDSSINSTGYAVIDEGGVILNYGTIKNNKKDDVVDKILNTERQLKDIFNDWNCEYIAIEKLALFRMNSTKTIQGLAGLYMCLLCEFRKKKYLVIEVYPSEWKSYCKIKGRKRQEQKLNSIRYVKSIIGEDEEIGDDIADAICIGLFGQSLELE